MEEIRKAYTKKYLRRGGEVMVAARDNPYPQMTNDSVRLRSVPDFGGLGAEMNWQFVASTLDMFKKPVKNEHERYIILMGGDMKNILELGGAVEIDIGATESELYTFKYEECVAVHIEAGLYYNIRITRVCDKKYPIFFNQTVFGVFGGIQGVASPLAGKKAAREDFEICFQTKDVIWAQHHPHHEVVYPSITITSRMFDGKTPLRRSWMAVSQPFAMEIKSHTHEFEQYLSFCGSDPENMRELGGTIEFTVGESPDALEAYESAEACQFYVKEGLYHSPLIFKSIDDAEKPILFCETSFTDNYGRSAEIGNTTEKSEFELFAEKMKAEGFEGLN